eukprot:178705_1
MFKYCFFWIGYTFCIAIHIHRIYPILSVVLCAPNRWFFGAKLSLINESSSSFSIVCVHVGTIYINRINGEENASCIITTLSTAAVLLISFDPFIIASNGDENAPIRTNVHCMALLCIVAMAGSGLFLAGMIDHCPLIKSNSIS